MERRKFLRNGAASGLAAAMVPDATSRVGDKPRAASEAEIRAITPERAPKPAGAYSQAVAAGGFVFVSGQVPRDPHTQELVKGDITVQTERVMENLKIILEAAGLSFERAVKTTVYLQHMGDFDAMNKVYSRYFTAQLPARVVVEVARLHAGAEIEIDLIARA
jgi:2-iminobutanoate/2-iminopropanoate deaminase